ncbi:MAG: tyrosine-type recombinase/integrase [Fermentimonas sp.]|nr:tyrosine-type recombinase/integrase [Fermentimonas sp.]
MNNSNYCVVSFEDGVFKELFLQFIQYKQGLGFQYGHSVQSCLLRINSILNEWQLEFPVLTKDMVECIIARRPEEAPATQQKRASLLRHFAEFMNAMGYESYVYPTFYNVKWIDCFAPYIFSQSQMQSIFSAADSLKPIKKSPLYHLVWPAFIRMLYGCGLRLSEALDLKTVNVDLEKGTLYVDKSKMGTIRYVPMSASLAQYCCEYAEKANLSIHEYFFPSPRTGRYSASAAVTQIKKIYSIAGIPRLSNGQLPRIHDLRHTFCCHALEQMQANGHDTYYALPLLSTYIGHQGIRDTERYLRLPVFGYSSIVATETKALLGIIPEVTEYGE